MQRAMVLLLVLAATAANAQTPRVVRSNGPGEWGAQVRLVEDLRIGVLDGDEDYVFAPIRGIVVQADGSIWVAERNPSRIRIYDADGRFVRAVGREGEGPGEYRQIDGMRRMRDGAVAVLDGRIGRITVYESSGELRTSHRFPVSLFTADMFHVDPEGSFYIRAWAQPSRPGEFAVARDEVLVRVNARGEVVDSVAIPRGETPAVLVYGGPYMLRLPPLIAARSPLGWFVTAAPMEYAFELHPPAGTVRVEREHRPVALTRAERGEWEAMARWLSRQPIGGFMRIVDGRPERVDGPSVPYTVPPVKPAIRSISVDDEGTIRVERYVAAEQRPPAPQPGGADPDRPVPTWIEPRTFDLYEPGGRFLGTIEAPPRVTLQTTRGTMVYGILRGEFDEQYVIRYRIIGSQ